MPIIISSAGGAGAIIREFGPEYLGGIGDLGAKIDAEATRSGLSANEIGATVHVPYYVCRRTNWRCIQSFQSYLCKQKENSSKFLAFLQCMTTSFSRRRYDLFERMEPMLNESMNV